MAHFDAGCGILQRANGKNRALPNAPSGMLGTLSGESVCVSSSKAGAPSAGFLCYVHWIIAMANPIRVAPGLAVILRRDVAHAQDAPGFPRPCFRTNGRAIYASCLRQAFPRPLKHTGNSFPAFQGGFSGWFIGSDRGGKERFKTYCV